MTSTLTVAADERQLHDPPNPLVQCHRCHGACLMFTAVTEARANRILMCCIQGLSKVLAPSVRLIQSSYVFYLALQSQGAFGRSMSNIHGELTGLYPTSMIAALTSKVCFPCSTGVLEDLRMSTYSESCLPADLAEGTVRDNVVFSLPCALSCHSRIFAPQASCMWPKQCSRGLARLKARRRLRQPASTPRAVIPKWSSGGPCVMMMSTLGKSGIGLMAMPLKC